MFGGRASEGIFMFHAFSDVNHVATKDFKDICTKIIKLVGGSL
jgi:hypothetical protein